MGPQESDQHDGEHRQRQQSDDALRQLTFHVELRVQNPDHENSIAKNDDRKAEVPGANGVDRSVSFSHGAEHRGEFLQHLKPEDRTDQKAERVPGPREEQLAETVARQVEDRIKVAVSGTIAGHESSATSVHDGHAHSQGPRDASSAAQIASSLVEEAIRQDPNIHPALKDKLRHQAALNLALGAGSGRKMSLEETEAALERLGEHVRRGWAKLHPLSEKELEAVRSAVRSQLERERHAQPVKERSQRRSPSHEQRDSHSTEQRMWIDRGR